MREESFTFVPAYQAQNYGSFTTLTVTINTTTGKFGFSSKSPESHDLIGKYVKTYVDKEKKTIAWTVFSEGNTSDLKYLKQVKLVGAEKQKTICFFDIAPINALGIKDTGTKKKLDVKRYKPQGMLDKNEYYYVVL